MKNVVIFAIDNGHDLHTQATFLRHLDTLRSMVKLKGEVKLCIGSWESQIERSYAMDRDDYIRHISQSAFVRQQKTVLRVGEEGDADLFIPAMTAHLGHVGVMREISPLKLDPWSGWTYVESEGLYYAAG